MIYISGPMEGIEDHNYPAFFALAQKLMDAGFSVLNPAALYPAVEGVPWEEYLRRDIRALMDCTSLALLPGWERSRGARLEHDVAERLRYRIWYPHELGELV